MPTNIHPLQINELMIIYFLWHENFLKNEIYKVIILLNNKSCE